jgi:selenocysteine lyase/cysteine desulfurase
MGKNRLTVPPDFMELRAEFPVTRKWAYLDIANKAPLPKCSQNGINEFLKDMNEFGAKEAFSIARTEEIRTLLAKLLGVQPHTLAFIKNTSEGLNIALQALGLKAGDNIIQADLDHPNQKYACKRLESKGVELRWIQNRNGCLHIEDFIRQMDDKTRIVSVSYVTFMNGFRLNIPDLAAACRERTIHLVVDAIQGIGVIATPLPALGADIVICGAHKGLLGLPGTGLLYCEESLISQMDPPFFARASMVPEVVSLLEVELAPDAHRFEIGNHNYMGLWVLGRSAEFLVKIGLKNIEDRVRLLTTHLINLLESKQLKILTPKTWEQRAGIVSIKVCDPRSLEAMLWKNGIVVSARNGALRISPHFYNAEEELEKLVCML